MSVTESGAAGEKGIVRARRRNELAVAFGRTYPALKMKASRIGVAIGDCRVTDLLPTSPAVLRRVLEPTCQATLRRASSIGVELTGQSNGTDLGQQTPAVLRRVLEPTCQATLRRASSSAADP